MADVDLHRRQATLRHDSALKHVTGQALYIDDMPEPPGTLHAALVLRPRAHARVRRKLDLRAAHAPGVVAVFTGATFPGKQRHRPRCKEEPLFAEDKVEFAGQPLFAVAADTLDGARRRRPRGGRVRADLPAILDIEDGACAKQLRAGEPTMHALGDAEAALAGAAQAQGPPRHRRPGAFLSRGPGRAGLPGRTATCWSTPRPSIRRRSSIWVAHASAGRATRSRSRCGAWAAASAARRPRRRNGPPSQRWPRPRPAGRSSSASTATTT